MNRIQQLISGRDTVILDGAMGTELAAMGLEMGGQNCLSHPDAVLAVHRSYVAAGCDMLITNTLTMNRIYLESHGMAVDVRAVNLAGARLAREAAGALPVLGDISSTGQLLEPYGDLLPETCEANFREQAEILAEGGVDGFVVETFVDLNEATCAVRACKAVAPNLPVLATLSFQSVQGTIMGNAPCTAARALADAGAAAVGANCTSLSWAELRLIAQEMTVGLPVILQPNAGKPRMEGSRPIFDMSPADFAGGMSGALTASTRILGGCCGTSPAHLRELMAQLGR